jgi:protein SERAC1
LDLEEWEYQFLAQYCDSQTAVSLARSFCDPNLIRKPQEFGKFRTKAEIISDIKGIFEDMKKHKCVKFILETTKAFEFLKDPDHDASPLELAHENDHILESLDHFLHLTTKPDVSTAIVERGGLEILLDIQKNFPDSFEIQMIIGKIVTNMTSAPMIADYFFKSGWISLLSQWQRDADLRIQVFASTSLNNLDKFDTSNFTYQPRIYPLYPRGKINEKPEIDVIFVHGILGGIWITWRCQRESDMEETTHTSPESLQSSTANLHNSFFQEEAVFKDEKIVQMEPGTSSKIVTITEQTTRMILSAVNEFSEENFASDELKLSRKILKHLVKKMNDQTYSYCWPIDWIPLKFPQIRVLGLQFESALSYWVKKVCPCEQNELKIRNRSADFLDRLKSAGVGEARPVLWVCHSMGGLIVKGIINKALASSDERIQNIAKNTRGIIFLGTPHKGSSIAKYSNQTQVLWPTIEVKDMEENSKELLKLNEEFLENITKLNSPVEIVSVAEGSSMKVFQNIKMIVVPIQSAYLGVGDFFVSNENHLNLSKPLSQNSFVYLTIVNLIQKILKQESTKS